MKPSKVITPPAVEAPPAMEHDYSRSGMVNALYKMEPHEFSGVARSLECFNNQGHSNFRIVTLYIEKGKVIRTELSDAYASWDAIGKLTYWTDLACIDLNTHWQNGKTLSK